MVTRAVYFLNRPHSSGERFLNRDCELGKVYDATGENSFLHTKTPSVTDQEPAGRVLRMVHRST